MVKRAVLAIDSREARTLARRAVRASSAQAVHELLIPVAAAMHAHATGLQENVHE